MLLLFDSKCNVCRNLAQKIHFSSEREVEIQALSSPESQTLLERHYPEGWEHDFYVLHDGKLSKGLRALPRLTRAIGLKSMVGLMAEYGQLKLKPQLGPKTCTAANGNGHDAAKRNLLKVAALSPLMFGFTKARQVAPLDEPSLKYRVHVAEVELFGDEFVVNVRPCPECLRPAAEQLRALPKGAGADMIESTVLGDESLTGDVRFKVQRVQYVKKVPMADGSIDERVMRVHSGMVDHPTFNLAMTFGQGPRSTTLAGMGRHDLPIPILDYVVFKTTGDEAANHLRAQAVGTRALADFHRERGLEALAKSYRDIAGGLEVLATRLAATVGETLLPGRNELVLTSMPEALRFAHLPREFQAENLETEVDAAGCDCSCSCSACCSCGCTVGLCVGPLPCDCDCCLGCGCGCGCCA